MFKYKNKNNKNKILKVINNKWDILFKKVNYYKILYKIMKIKNNYGVMQNNMNNKKLNG